MMQSDKRYDLANNNVINLFTGRCVEEQASKSIIQVCPESSGIRMLYSSHHAPERLIAVPLLCWGLRADGEVVGLVPWINEIADCTTIDENLDVSWEGYYLTDSDTIFYDAPEQIVAQLATAMRFNEHYVEDASTDTATDRDIPVFIKAVEADVTQDIGGTTVSTSSTTESTTGEIDLEDIPIVQEVPDLIGTHALLVDDEAQTLTLTPVVSWVLDTDGELHGMLVDEDAVEKTPVVPGDECLYVATSNANFRCYFQRDIAEQIRVRNPETMAAIEKLLAT